MDAYRRFGMVTALATSLAGSGQPADAQVDLTPQVNIPIFRQSCAHLDEAMAAQGNTQNAQRVFTRQLNTIFESMVKTSPESITEADAECFATLHSAVVAIVCAKKRKLPSYNGKLWDYMWDNRACASSKGIDR